MAKQLRCPQCQKVYRLPDTFVGGAVKCKCGKVSKIAITKPTAAAERDDDDMSDMFKDMAAFEDEAEAAEMPQLHPQKGKKSRKQKSEDAPRGFIPAPAASAAHNVPSQPNVYPDGAGSISDSGYPSWTSPSSSPNMRRESLPIGLAIISILHIIAGSAVLLFYIYASLQPGVRDRPNIVGVDTFILILTGVPIAIGMGALLRKSLALNFMTGFVFLGLLATVGYFIFALIAVARVKERVPFAVMAMFVITMIIVFIIDYAIFKYLRMSHVRAYCMPPNVMEKARLIRGREVKRDELSFVAKSQKGLLLCIGSLIVIVILLPILVLLMPDSFLSILPTIMYVMKFLVVISAICVLLLSLRLYGIAVGLVISLVATGLLVFVPVLGIAMLFIVNFRASNLLQANGIPVGLLGANSF